jgi:hypothetical protein
MSGRLDSIAAGKEFANAGNLASTQPLRRLVYAL